MRKNVGFNNCHSCSHTDGALPSRCMCVLPWSYICIIVQCLHVMCCCLSAHTLHDSVLLHNQVSNCFCTNLEYVTT